MTSISTLATPKHTKRRITHELNVRFLLGSLIVAAVVGLTTYGVWKWQLHRTAEIFLRRAEQSETESKWQDAARYIGRYLQLVPTASEERVHLARVYAKGAVTYENRQRAISLCYLAIADGTPKEETSLRRQVGDLLLENSRFIEAETESKKLLQKSPKDVAGLRIQAMALLGQYRSGSLAQEPRESIQIIETVSQARKANPGDLTLATVLADLYCPVPSKAATTDLELVRRELPDVSEKTRGELASACLDELVQFRPKDPFAYLSRFHFRRKWGISGAAEDLQTAIKLAPNNVLIAQAAAQDARTEANAIIAAGGSLMDSHAKLAAAVTLYQQIIKQKLDERNPGVYLALGEVFAELGQKEQAIQTWQTGLGKFKDASLAFHERIAQVYLEMGQLNNAEDSLTVLDKTIPPISREHRLLFERDQSLRRGYWHLKRGEAKLAISPLQQVMLRQAQLGGKSQQSIQACLLLGQAHARLGAWVDSATAFDRAAVEQPNSAVPTLLASASWLAANRVSAAIDRAEQGVRIQPTSQSWFTLAKACLQQQLVQPTEPQNEKRLEQAMTEAVRLVDDGTLKEPWRVYLLQAEHLAAGWGVDSATLDQRRLQAVSILERAEDKFPSEIALFRALPLNYELLRERTAAERSWKKFSQLPSTASEAPLIWAQVLLTRGEYDAAEKLLTESLSKSALTDPVAVRREQIEVKLARGDVKAAHRLLTELHQILPLDTSALVRLAEIELEIGSPDALIRVEKQWEPKLANCEGDGKSFGQYFKIRRLIHQSRSPTDPLLASASVELSELLQMRPNWPQAIALGGLIDQMRGDNDAAISAYEMAISLGERHVSVYERLISLLDSSGRSSDTVKYLSQLRGIAPFSQELTTAESSLEVLRNQPELAVATARRGVERRPTDASAHVWLGRMLLVNEQFTEAEKSFESAVALQPEALQPWGAMFAYYQQTKNVEKARETLRRLTLNIKLPPDERDYVSARLHEELGDKRRADELYESAMQTSGNPALLVRLAGHYLSIDSVEAEKCVKRALEIDPRSGEAQRTLALILAKRGNNEDWVRSEKLLNSPVAGQNSTQQNLLLRALLLDQRGGKSNLMQAISILEERIAGQTNPRPDERLMLAKFYEKMSRISAPKEANPLETHTREYYLQLCQSQYSSLCSGTKVQPAHLVAFVEFLVRQNQRDAAVKWLAKLTETMNVSSVPMVSYFDDCVRLNLALGDLKSAEYWQSVLEKTFPDSLPTVELRVQLIAKGGDFSKIEAYLETAATRLLKKVPNEKGLATTYQRLGNVYRSHQQLPQAERWFRKLFEQEPAQFSPLVQILAQQGQVAEALNICLKKDDAKTSSAALAATFVLASSKATMIETQRAEQLISAAMARDTKDVRLRLEVGVLRAQQGRTDDAIELFNEVVGLDKENVAALNNLATLLAERPGQRQEALKWIDQAIDISGSEPALIDTKATILIFEGEAAKALDLLQIAIGVSDADPRFRFHLALAYRDLNDLSQAKSQLQMALEKDLTRQILTPIEQDLLAKLRSTLSL